MRYGFFDDVRKEYVVTTPATPLPWINYLDSLSEDNALDVTVNNTSDADWKVQIKQNNVLLEEGKTYKLTFKAKSSIDRPVRVVMQGLEPLGWPVYSSDPVFNLTADYQTFTDTFTMNAASDPNAFLSICLGQIGDFQSAEQHRVVIDDITLEEVVSTPPVEPPVEPPVQPPAQPSRLSNLRAYLKNLWDKTIAVVKYRLNNAGMGDIPAGTINRAVTLAEIFAKMARQ